MNEQNDVMNVVNISNDEPETALVRRSTGELQTASAMMHLKPAELQERAAIVQSLIGSLLIEGKHFGKIDGCGDKPALYQSGAEILNMAFMMAPKYDVTVIDLPNNHKEYRGTCSLYAIADGRFLGSAMGSATTMETKHLYRNASRKCPKCGAEAIKRSKYNDKGWYCFAKIGGCGEKFRADDPTITEQEVGQILNDNPADQYNTCLKMSCKRSFTSAVKTVTATSDRWTVDIEEKSKKYKPDGYVPNNDDDYEPEPESKPKASKPAPAPAVDPKALGKRIKALQKELDMTQEDLEEFCENAVMKRNGFTIEETETIIERLELVKKETEDVK